MDDFIINDVRKQAMLVVTVVLSVFTFSIDYSMLNISLPTVAEYFKVNLAAVSALPTVYILVVTSSLLGFGKLGDIRGYGRIFTAGLVVFLAGTMMSAFAPSIKFLIISRIVQSFGEAMFSPVGLAMLTTFLPSDRRGRALGFVALTQGLGMALGTMLGGYINQNFVWRAIFLVNIPVIILTALAGARTIGLKQPLEQDKRFDIFGSALIFAALSALIYALNSMSRPGFKIVPVVICLAVSSVLLAMFIIRQKRIAYPLLDLKLFSDRSFTFACLSAFFMVLVLMGFLFLAPFYLEMVRRESVMASGIFLMIPPLVMLVLAPVAGWISDRAGSRVICTAGCLAGAVSCAFLFTFDKSAPGAVAAAVLVLFGAAAGAFMAPNNRLVMMRAPQDKQGQASGVYKICLSSGSVFGIALLSTLVLQAAAHKAAALNIPMANARATPEVILYGFRFAFAACVASAGMAALFSFLAEDKR